MKKLLYIFLVLLTSCATQMSTLQTTVETAPKGKLSEFFSGYRYVMLETNEKCVLYNYKKLKVNDKYISVVAQDRIFLFNNKSGKFVSVINHKGRGHGEYIEVTDYDIYNDKIWIYSGAQRALFIYDKSGKYLKKINLNDYYSKIKVIDDKKVFFSPSYSNSSGYNFVLYDIENQKVLKQFDPFDKNQSYIFSSFNDFLSCNGNNIYVSHPFDNTLYKLTEDDYCPIETFDFITKDKLTSEELLLDRELITNLTRQRSVFKYLNLYYKSDHSSLLGYSVSDEFSDSYYITRLKEDGSQTTVRLLAELDETFPYISDISCIYNDEFVSSMNSSSITYIETNYDIDKKFMNSGYSKEDNPIVFFHKIKK